MKTAFKIALLVLGLSMATCGNSEFNQLEWIKHNDINDRKNPRAKMLDDLLTLFKAWDASGFIIAIIRGTS